MVRLCLASVRDPASPGASPTRTVRIEPTGPRYDRKFEPPALGQNQTAADIDGLLRAGEPGVQFTWMDAKVV